VKLVAFVGLHDAGKTTLVEKVARLLKERGYRVCYLKHDPKGHGVTDREGSDTWRVKPFCRKAGLLSPSLFTLWELEPPPLKELIRRYFNDCDVLLLEGFKSVGWLPKVVVGELKVENAVLKVGKDAEPEDIIKLIEELEEVL